MFPAHGGVLEHLIYLFYSYIFLTLLLSSFWTSRGHICRPFSSGFLPLTFIAHRVQQSHCSSIFHRVLLIHAVALSASQIVHKKKSRRIYTSMHFSGLEPTKLTYTRLEDNLIRHRGDRLIRLHESTYIQCSMWVSRCYRSWPRAGYDHTQPCMKMLPVLPDRKVTGMSYRIIRALSGRCTCS